MRDGSRKRRFSGVQVGDLRADPHAHFPERSPRIVVLDSAIVLATPATRELLKPVPPDCLTRCKQSQCEAIFIV